jgi:hypothetical protein
VSGVPLWYADWNKKDSFDNFTKFGGWTRGVIKQNDVGFVCNISVDFDWC